MRAVFSVAAAYCASAAAHGACKTAADCGLNGECIDGACHCDDGWKSANCTALDLRPAPVEQGYMTNRSSWGGNVVPGKDGKYHLFFSEMSQDGLHQFQTTCQAAHAVGDSVFGPFKRVDTSRGIVSHNVQPMIGPDGAVYVFMIGSDTPGRHGPVMVGRAQNESADFEWLTPTLLNLTGQAVDLDNPTAIMYKNGTVLLVTRGLSLFVADSWRGPYHMKSESIFPCGESCKTEDPFIWQSTRGLHMLMHDHKPFAFHKQVITYGFTEDLSGVSGWTFSWQEAANGKDVQFEDGSTHTFCSRQRPQLIFSKLTRDGVEHGRPVALVTGVQRGKLTEITSECGIANENSTEYNPYPDYSFTFLQPLGRAASRAAIVV